MRNSALVDLHCHPDLKSFLSAEGEITRKNCWPNISLPPLGQIIDQAVLHNILGSQSSLSQLDGKKGTVAVVGLYAFERSMIKGDLFNLFLVHFNLLTVSRILEFLGYHDILCYKLMKRISKRRAPLFSIFNEAYSHMLVSGVNSPGFNLLKNMGDYDPQKLNIILTAEGGHNLFRRKCGCFTRINVMRNVRKLKTGINRFLFVGPAHIERNALCTHAYAIKLLHHRQFFPVGYGLRPLGKAVIRKLLKKPGRILVDVKHMSLITRKQFYDILRSMEETPGVPIIASHVGVTGVSWDRMPVDSCRPECRWVEVQYHQPPGHIAGTAFNPWSINLYDEEITEIIRSAGIIGLSLDARILGARQSDPADLVEYFSIKEFTFTESGTHPVANLQHNFRIPSLLPPDSNYMVLDGELKNLLNEYIQKVIRDPESIEDYADLRNRIEIKYEEVTNEAIRINLDGIMADFDFEHLCNNILHIVNVGGPDAWNHICIGSDFDGLVEAVRCCKDVSKFTDLSVRLKNELPILAAAANPPMTIANIDQKIDNLMSGNAFSFLRMNFN